MSIGNTSVSFPPFPELPLRYSNRNPDGPRTGEEPFLRSVQGNILKGHGRNHQRFVFFKFASRERGLKLLKKAAGADGVLGRDRWVCAAIDHHQQRLAWEKALVAEALLSNPSIQFTDEERSAQKTLYDAGETQLFGSLMLTRSGLDFLGVRPPSDEAFQSTMADRMRDTLVEREMESAPYHPAESVHAVFLLASNHEDSLKGSVSNLTAWCRDFSAESVGVPEEGMAWREAHSPYGNGYRPPREPFGFADGISQPYFFAEDRVGPMRNDRPPAWEWTDLKLEHVFLSEKGHEGGSFATLLKIEQHVGIFREHERKVVDLLTKDGFLPKKIAEYVAPAILMGRTRHGYPLHEVIHRLTPTEQGLLKVFLQDLKVPVPGPNGGVIPELPSWLNEFDFEPRVISGTPLVSRCPFHMHARKMNPRTDNSAHGNQDTFVAAQPVRRGATYDPYRKLAAAEKGGDVWPNHDVGLLFFAYMSNLNRQFETLHTFWTADWTFPQTGGIDPILSQPNPAAPPPSYVFGPATMPTMPKVVHRMGGLYLYVPSIPWLRRAGL